MARELLRRFLAHNARLCALVGAGSGAIAFFLASLFPDMPARDARSVSESWPPLLRQVFGDPLLAFTDVHAWLHLEMFHIVFWVVHGGFAAVLASRILAAEAEDRTLEVLLSVPVSRARLVAARLAGVALLVGLSALPVLGGCVLGIAWLGQDVRPAPLLSVTATGVLLALGMGAAALCASVWVPRRTFSAFAALALFAVLFFVEEMLGALVPALAGLAAWSPFHYYRASELLVHGAPLGAGAPLALLGIFLGLAALATAGFQRRDAPL